MKLNLHYILDDDNNPVIVEDILEWARWCHENDHRKRVGKDEGWVEADSGKRKFLRVSTVFLGLNHRFTDDGPPLLFETMIFENNDYTDLWMYRYSTWEKAQAGHAAVCAELGLPTNVIAPPGIRVGYFVLPKLS